MYDDHPPSPADLASKGDEQTFVSFDRQKAARLRKAYNKAREQRLETFTFDGKVWVTAYAKYALQYLDSVLGRR